MRRDEIISLISKIKRDMPHNKPVMHYVRKSRRESWE